ncbi:hypothetical protein [Desertivibrio insolitus]|uniref:hypothetical protein n=1 Tax=Herbiconiux sp. SYSU D00978 TaxID=2812562 RepID=UPI001A95DF46|nr:hypothetical protein [Herbiconiux sp. SYSU D00978]
MIRLPPDRLATHQWIVGTALSAPNVMLVAQTALVAALAVRPLPWAARGLGALGGMMAAGYLMEAGFPEAIRQPDREKTPILLGGFALALAMGLLGSRAARSRGSIA